MNLAHTIKEILHLYGCKIQETQLFPDSDNACWHSTVIDSDNFTLSAGYSHDLSYARKVAIAEFIEYIEFKKISNRSDWGPNLISTACGFAAGFDLANTKLRSVKESVERWVMSKWIDEHYYIEQLEAKAVEKEFNKASLFFRHQFDRVLYFKKDVQIQVDGRILQVPVAQTMGFKDNGIYPGSSTQDIGNGIWEHALLESFRHLLGVKNNPKRINGFPDNRIYFFSENASVALDQIKSADIKSWPIPIIKLHNYKSLYEGKIFLARTIVDGWKSWDQGPVYRFLY